MLKEVCESDHIEMQKPDIEESFMRALKESFVQGSRGPAREASICYREWDFDIGDITFPVRLWLGDQDIWVSNEMGELMQRKIKNSVAHIMEDTGHICIRRWYDVFADIAARHKVPVS